MSEYRETKGNHLLPTTKVLLEIESERHQHLTREGWTDDHDDQHELGEMAMAASCYAEQSCCSHDHPQPDILDRWPWAHGWWKPTNPRRDLVKAAALIVAEIERLDRSNDSE